MADRFRSYEAMVAARNSSLTATQRSVLNAVALRADEGAECWASVATLAADTGLGERTVQAAMKALRSMKIIVEEPLPGRSTTRRIVVEAIPQRVKPPATAAPPPPQLLHPGGATAAPPQLVRPATAAPAPATAAPPPPQLLHPGGATDAPAPATAAPDPSRIRPVIRPGDPSTDTQRAGVCVVLPANDGDEALAYLTARAMQDKPEERLPGWTLPGPVQTAVRLICRRGATADDVRLVEDWRRESMHREAVFLREGRHGWRTIANDRWAERLEFAREWEAAGRVDAVRSDAGRRGGTMDRLRAIDEKWAEEERRALVSEAASMLTEEQ